jgi:membrane-associated two-gene conflict system component 1 (EACC1)
METKARLNLWLGQGGADGELAELCALLEAAGAEHAHQPVMGDPTPGRRGAENGIVDVVATLTPTLGLVERVVAALRGWLAKRPQRSLTMSIDGNELEVKNYSIATEELLIKAWIQRVCDRP